MTNKKTTTTIVMIPMTPIATPIADAVTSVSEIISFNSYLVNTKGTSLAPIQVAFSKAFILFRNTLFFLQ